MSEENNTQPEDDKEVKAPEAVEETAKTEVATETSSNEKVAAPVQSGVEGSEAPRNNKPAVDDAKEAAPAKAETSSNEEVASPTEEGSVRNDEPEAKELPLRNLKPGMVVRVHETIKDVNTKGEERTRTQVFEGTILGFAGSGIARTMTVRKVSNGFGVEKIYPLSSPHVEKVEVIKEQRVRRAKLWFLRKGFKRRLKASKIA